MQPEMICIIRYSPIILETFAKRRKYVVNMPGQMFLAYLT